MGKALNPAVNSPDADVKLLLHQIMPLTQQRLEEQMGFPPVAALVALDGSVQRIESNAGPEDAAKQVAGLLRERLRQEVALGAVRAAAVAADVRIWRKRDGEEASNAVSVHVENQDGYCVDLLIPYKVRKGIISRITRKKQVMFRQMIAQESQPEFWVTSGEGRNDANET